MIALLQALLSGLAVGGAYALVALGFSITFTTTKTLNFSHGEFVSVGRLHRRERALPGRWESRIIRPLVGVTLPGLARNCSPLSSHVVVMGVARLAALLRSAVQPFAGQAGHGLGDEHARLRRHPAEHRPRHLGADPVVVPSPVGDDVIRMPASASGRRKC